MHHILRIPILLEWLVFENLMTSIFIVTKNHGGICIKFRRQIKFISGLKDHAFEFVYHEVVSPEGLCIDQ